MNYDVYTILSSEYPDGIKAYYVEVIRVFREELNRDLNMLGKYRLSA